MCWFLGASLGLVYGGALGTNEGTGIGSLDRKCFGATIGDVDEISFGARDEKELRDSVTGQKSL